MVSTVRTVSLGFVLLVVVLTALQWSDVQRYLKIRAM